MYSKKCDYCTDSNCPYSPCYSPGYDRYNSDWFAYTVAEAWEADQRWRSEAFW